MPHEIGICLETLLDPWRCDAAGPVPAPEDYVAAAVSRRPLPGDGEVDIPGAMSVLEAAGADPFFAMEVFNCGLLARGPQYMARRLRAADGFLQSGAAEPGGRG